MIKVFLNTAVSNKQESSPTPPVNTYTVDGAEVGTFSVSGNFVTFTDPSNIFDRSNVSNFEADARGGFYDGANPTKWHYTELNIDTVTSWLIDEERIYFAPPENMSAATEIHDISTFTTTQTGQDAIDQHNKVGHILLTDSLGSTLLDSNNLPLWDN